jgi:hypothetical protein
VIPVRSRKTLDPSTDVLNQVKRMPTEPTNVADQTKGTLQLHPASDLKTSSRAIKICGRRANPAKSESFPVSQFE